MELLHVGIFIHRFTYLAYAFSINAVQNSFPSSLFPQNMSLFLPLMQGSLSSMITSTHLPYLQKLKWKIPGTKMSVIYADYIPEVHKHLHLYRNHIVQIDVLTIAIEIFDVT